jgi:ribosome recycling factor
MTASERLLKDLETSLAAATQKLKTELGQVRGSRPSPDLVQDLKVNLYDQQLSIRELGSLSVLPPLTLQIAVWDKNSVGAVVKAIEAAHLGLSVTNEGSNIRATLSPLGNERREELARLVKKTAETTRIQIRARRDEGMKRLKDAENKKEATEDEVFKAKEKIQKAVDKANGEVEKLVREKMNELGA